MEAMKMKVKMLKDCQGSNNGKFVQDYKENEVYNLSESLANSFIELKVAVACEEKAKQQHENKAQTESDYQNKSDKPKSKKLENK
jgi:hypothetical protein